MKTQVHIGPGGLTIETENMLITIEARQLPELTVESPILETAGRVAQTGGNKPGEWERHITPRSDQEPESAGKTLKEPEAVISVSTAETAGRRNPVCAMCGQLFEAKQRNSRFCSKPCSQKHYTANWVAKKAQKKVSESQHDARFYDPRMDPMTGKRAQEK